MNEKKKVSVSAMGLQGVKLDLNKSEYQSKNFQAIKFCQSGFNPKKTKGGRNQDAACLDALPVQQGKGTIIKTPCICHFASLKPLYKIQFKIHMKTF